MDSDDYGYATEKDEQDNSSISYQSSIHNKSEEQSLHERSFLNSEEDEEESSSEELNEEHVEIIEETNDDMDPNKERITIPFLAKYEKSRILGIRAQQIAKNAPLYDNIVDTQELDPLSIAQLQLSNNKIPFLIRRYLPDGTFEDWKLTELKKFTS